jgi:hypothetical protein
MLAAHEAAGAPMLKMFCVLKNGSWYYNQTARPSSPHFPMNGGEGAA